MAAHTWCYCVQLLAYILTEITHQRLNLAIIVVLYVPDIDASK